MTSKMLLFYFSILESGGTAAFITRRLIKLYTYDMCACVHYASLKKFKQYFSQTPGNRLAYELGHILSILDLCFN